MTKYWITKGLIKSPKANKDSFVGLQSIDAIFKDLLSLFKVTSVDTCCTSDPLNRPVRFNITLNVSQYLDLDNTTWVNIP